MVACIAKRHTAPQLQGSVLPEVATGPWQRREAVPAGGIPDGKTQILTGKTGAQLAFF